jgi:hypothetical protein
MEANRVLSRLGKDNTHGPAGTCTDVAATKKIKDRSDETKPGREKGTQNLFGFDVTQRFSLLDLPCG